MEIMGNLRYWGHASTRLGMASARQAWRQAIRGRRRPSLLSYPWIDKPPWTLGDVSHSLLGETPRSYII